MHVHFHVAALLYLGMATVDATPLQNPEDGLSKRNHETISIPKLDPDDPIFKPRWKRYCSELYTIENKTSGKSPKNQDCRHIIHEMGPKYESYSKVYTREDTTDPVDVGHYGTCGFNVKWHPSLPRSSPRDGARIGSEDVSIIMQDAIARYGWEGITGASGLMLCRSAHDDNKWVSLEWGLHSGKG